MIERTIVAALLADSTLTGLVGDRVSPFYRPEADPLPGVIYELRDERRIQGLKGSIDTIPLDMEFASWASSYSAADAIAKRIAELLANYSVVDSGNDCRIRSTRVIDRSPAVEAPIDGRAVPVFSASVTIRAYAEAI